MAEIPLPQNADDSVVDLGHGLSYQWIAEQRILDLKFRNASRQAIDIWADNIHRILSIWDLEKPYLTMYEVASLPITPHFRKRSVPRVELSKQRGVQGRLAVVLRPSFTSRIIKFFAERELDTMHPGVVRRIFTSREVGLRWLEELL